MKIMNRKGSAGLGTMIVMIGIVLVSVIASSVVIRNANLIGQQTERTGVKASEEAGIQYEIIHVYGDRWWSETGGEPVFTGYIRWLHIKVTLAAGSPAQDIKYLVVEIANKSKSWDFTYTPVYETAWTGANAPNRFDIEELRDPEAVFEETSATMTFITTGSVLQILVNLSQPHVAQDGIGSPINVEVQDELDIRLLSKHGQTAYELVTAPDAFIDRYIELY